MKPEGGTSGASDGRKSIRPPEIWQDRGGLPRSTYQILYALIADGRTEVQEREIRGDNASTYAREHFDGETNTILIAARLESLFS